MKGIKTKVFLAPIAFSLLIGCSNSDSNKTDLTAAEDSNMDQAENDPGGSSMDGRFSPMTMNEEIVMRDSETNLEWVNGLAPNSNKPETGCHPMPPGLATDGVIVEAQLFCENLNFATHTDWRVPSVFEIQQYTVNMESSGLIPFYQNPQCPRVVGINTDGTTPTVSTVNTHNIAPTGTINEWESKNAGVRCVRDIGAES